MDGIERDLAGRTKVVRLNVLSAMGSQAAQRYGVGGVPALIVFDGQGRIAYEQAGIPQRARIVATSRGRGTTPILSHDKGSSLHPDVF